MAKFIDGIADGIACGIAGTALIAAIALVPLMLS